MSETYTEVLARLRGAQKGRARGAPAYSVYINRRVGRFLAAAAYKAGLNPNQVTMVSAAFTTAGIALVALVRPNLGWSIAVWLLLALGYAWDSADGQVARLRGGGSLGGEWLDHFVDAAKVITIHLAVVVGLYRFGDVDARLLLIPLGFAIVSGVTFFAMILNDLLRSARGVPSAAARGGSSPVRSLLLLPTDYGALCLTFVLWSFSGAFLVLYTAAFVACSLFLVLAATKWFREISALAEPG
jgi:phosphatidylglycerophosphate synthase